jgi:hypothetical protein
MCNNFEDLRKALIYDTSNFIIHTVAPSSSLREQHKKIFELGLEKINKEAYLQNDTYRKPIHEFLIAATLKRLSFHDVLGGAKEDFLENLCEDGDICKEDRKTLREAAGLSKPSRNRTRQIPKSELRREDGPQNLEGFSNSPYSDNQFVRGVEKFMDTLFDDIPGDVGKSFSKGVDWASDKLKSRDESE